MQKLTEIADALSRKFHSRAQMAPTMVRVALQTGVNLLAITPAQDANPKLVASVQKALSDLGYNLF